MRFSLLLLSVVLLASCAKQDATLTTATIQTPTIVCGTCAKTIEKALYRVEGVKNVDVDIEKKFVEVKYIPLQTNQEYLESTITSVGYDANDKKRDPDAYAQLDECCKFEKN